MIIKLFFDCQYSNLKLFSSKTDIYLIIGYALYSMKYGTIMSVKRFLPDVCCYIHTVITHHFFLLSTPIYHTFRSYTFFCVIICLPPYPIQRKTKEKRSSKCWKMSPIIKISYKDKTHVEHYFTVLQIQKFFASGTIR